MNLYLDAMSRYYFGVAIIMLAVLAIFFAFGYRGYSYSLNAFQQLFHQTLRSQADQIIAKSDEFAGWDQGQPDTNVTAQLFALEIGTIKEQAEFHSICVIDQRDRVVLDPSGHFQAEELYPLEIYKPWHRPQQSQIRITPPVELEGQSFIAMFFGLGQYRCVVEVSALVANSLYRLKQRLLAAVWVATLLLALVGVAVFVLFRTLRKAEERMVQQERLAVIGEMSAVIAHEIKNPLGIMRTSAQLVQEASQVGEGEKRALRYIMLEVDRLDRKVREFLQLAREIKPSLVKMDMVALVQSLLDNYETAFKQKGIELELRGLESPCMVMADQDQIVQVFHNLVGNAMESMASGGYLKVAAESVDTKCRVSFSDNGPGISPQEQERVFEPFYTKKSRGTGLGLAVSKRIVDAHGGKLYLGDCAHGCTMIVELPMEKA